MSNKDFFKQFEEYQKNKDYISCIKLITEDDEQSPLAESLIILTMKLIEEILNEMLSEKKFQEALDKLDEILEIKGIPINLKCFCLTNQGIFLMKISDKNAKIAFDKFYLAFELRPNPKFAFYIEKAFPYNETYNEVQIYINKVYKYKETFSANFISRLGLFEMILNFEKKEYEKAYNIGVIHMPNIAEVMKHNKDAISSISFVFIIVGSEVYLKYMQKKDLDSGEKVYNNICNNLKNEEDKNKAQFLLGVMLIISNEFEILFSKFDSMSEGQEKDKLKTFAYVEYIKTNLNQKKNFEKCLNYINILKSINTNDEDIKDDINHLDFLIFIRKCEIDFEKNDFSSSEKIDQMLEKEINIKNRVKLENLKKTLIKKKKDFYFKEKKYDEFLSENKNMINIISQIYQEESIEEIEKNNFDLALNKIDKALEIEPKNTNYINEKAFINTQKGKYDQAIKDIDSAIIIDPDNKILQNNKIEIIDKKYENITNQILNQSEKEYIENAILENSDISIQNNSIDLSLKLTRNKMQEIGQDKMKEILDKNILCLKENDNKNIINEENNQFTEKEKIILASKSSELILENIKNNKINILDKEIKEKMEKCLDIKEKDIQSNVLSAYSQIKNLKKEEMEKPLQIINTNLKYEVDIKEINQNIDVIQNFLEQEINLEVKSEITSNLLEIISINDYTKYSEEEREKDEVLDNKKTVFQYFKDKTKEGIAKQLKETIDEYSYDENLYNQIKKDVENYIDIDNNILKHSQREKKKTNEKIFNCIQTIAKSKNGLTEKNLENLGNLLEKFQDNANNASNDYKNFVKKKIVETVNLSLQKKEDAKIPNNLIDNLSKELNNNSIENKEILNILDKASDNQKLTEEAQDNLINILVDKNIENKSEINKDDKNYELTYQILNKDYSNLSEIQKQVVDLEKNTIIINKENKEENIINCLENISSIVNNGYSINKHTEKTILNLLNKNERNENYLVKSTEVINNMAKNSINISNEMSDFIVKKIDENRKKPILSKNAFTELLACLVNIIDNCNIPNNSIEAFQNCLNDYKNKDKKAELKLAITGLSILSKKHYSLNKEAINSCLDIIESNILDEESLKELSDIIDIIFKETEIDNNTFSKLLSIIIKNPEFLDQLSICLINSLKFKKTREIEDIITINLKNFEKMILNHTFNNNIISIIKMFDANFYQSKNPFIYEFYCFDLLYSKNTMSRINYKKGVNFINKYGILDEKYLSIIFNNLSTKEDVNLLEKIIEKNPKYLKREIYDKMLKIRTESSLFKDILKTIKKFSNYFLPKETIDLLCEKCQTNKKEIYEPIIELFKIFFEKNNKIIPNINNNDILEIELKEEKNDEYLTLIKDFINKSNFIPDRYFYKLLQIMKSENNLFDIGFNIILSAINKNIVIPNEIIDQLLDYKNKELNINLIQSILINKNYNKKYNKKILTILEGNSNENNLEIINNLQSLIEFANLENSIKEFILKNINIFYDTLTDYKKICFWIFQDSSFVQKLFNEIKKSKYSDSFKDFDKFKKYEDKINYFLNDGIFLDKLEELSDNDINNLNLLKISVNNFEEKVLKDERDKKFKLIKLLDFFICQKIKYALNFEQILKCFDFYLSKDNYFQLYNKFESFKENCLNRIRRNWIKIQIFNNNIKYSTDILNIILDNFYTYDFDDSLIEKTIKLSIFTDFENLNQLFKYLNENKSYLDEIKKVIYELEKNDSIETFKNKSIIVFSEKKISNYSFHSELKKIYLLIVECLIKNNWKLYQIDEFLSKKIKFNSFDEINESYIKNVIIPIIDKNKIEYNSKNNKNENLITILSKYENKHWEYLLKLLGQEQNFGNIDLYSLDNLLFELKEKNKDISHDICEKIKNIILEIRYKYNLKIEDSLNDLPNYPINMYEKKDIQKWSKSKRTLSLINNEEFLSEILAIIDRANSLQEGHHIREVQFISILLILLSPKNKGAFAQIKTGEGKSTIVSVIAVIKSLQNTYVDILSSSIILAQRDKDEKKEFYDYFNLTVGSNDDEEGSLYENNIVYGDTLMFEGDILSYEFSQNPISQRAKNPKRGFRCIIIDEVDSMCIDNLGSSTRLSSSFPSYEYLKILYPLIYNNLNLIEEHLEKGQDKKYKGVDEEEKKKYVIDNLIKVTIDLLDTNKKADEKFILPKNLEKYIKNQIRHWCNSAYEAKHYYKENYHYVIGKDKLDDKQKKLLEKRGYIPEEYYRIAPVDFSNTGVVELHMSWSDGLSQFLQIKHGLKLRAEDLTTTFISHYSFFQRYINSNENNIYGVTGTIGTNKTKYALKILFNVNIFVIPPFKPSKLIILNNKAQFKSKEEWKNEIYNNIILNTNELHRTVLIICFTIEESNELYDFITKKGYNKNKIYKYQRNDDESNKLPKRKYEKGDIILATNLAGRGTDIKLSEEVEKNGGMHVIVTFLPNNQRVEEQAIGRTARSGAKGSSIIIVNDSREINNIKNLRDFREENRINYITQIFINKIKLKDELFNNFSLFYHELQSKLIKEDLLSMNPLLYAFYKEQYSNEFSILDDLEERWGIWLKEIEIDDSNNNKTEKEIKENYKTFENNMRKIFFQESINNIPLSNPLNYFSSYRFNDAYEKDLDLCMFSNYLKNMNNIKSKTESISDNTIKTLDSTISYLKDNISPQIQSISILANSIRNNIIFIDTKKDEISEDTDKKLKAIENLINKLENNKETIKQYLEKNQRNSEVILKKCELFNITKSLDIINYLTDIGIPFYYETTFKKGKNWIGIISLFVIGACEIALGIALTHFMKNDFGMLTEGIKDIGLGINCILGNEEFDWKELGKRKLMFVISLAVNNVVNFIRLNLKLPFNLEKPSSIKDTFKLVGDKVKEDLTKKVINTGIGLSMKVFGKDFIVNVVAEFKKYSKKLTISFFKENIKESLINKKKYGDTFEQMLTIEVISGKNDWTRILTEQLKIGCRILSKLIELITKQLIKIIKMLMNNKDDWKQILLDSFTNLTIEGLDLFKDSLGESLDKIKLGFLNIFKKFADKKLPEGVKNGFLTLNDILDKALDIGDSLKTKQLMNILVENDIIKENGIINGKLIFGGSYNQKNSTPIPIITDKFKKFVVNKTIGANNLMEYLIQQINTIVDELETLLKSKIDESVIILNDFMDKKLIDINNYIDDLFNKYVIESINKIETNLSNKLDNYEQQCNKIEQELNEKINKFDDLSKKIEDNLVENISKIDNILVLIKDKVNEKIKFFEDLIEKQIDEKINTLETTFKNSINITSKIDDFMEQIQTQEDNLNDSLSNINELTDNKANNQINNIQTQISNIKNKLNESKNLISEFEKSIEDKINNIKDIWKKIKNSETLEQVKNTIKYIQTILEDIITKINDFLKSVKEKVNEILNIIKTKSSLIVDKLKSIKEKIKEGKQSLPEIIQTIKDELNKIKEEIKNQIQQIKQVIMDKIQSIKQNIYDKISEFIKEMKLNFESYVNLLKDLLAQLEKFILEKIDLLNDKIDLSQISNFFNNIGKNFDKFLNSNIIKEKIEQTDKLISDKIHNALEDIDFKEFKEKKNQIIQNLKEYQKKIDEYDFNSKKNETFNILQDCIVEMLIDVISEAVNGTEIGKYLKEEFENFKNIVNETSKYIDELD